MSSQGKKIVGLALILAPILFIVLFAGLAIYRTPLEVFSIVDFLSHEVLLLGILLSALVILVTYVTQIFIDKTNLPRGLQQFIRYFSLLGYLLMAPVAFPIQQVLGGKSSDCYMVIGLIIVFISFILTGIGFLRANDNK